jgi:hypothetical protein
VRRLGISASEASSEVAKAMAVPAKAVGMGYYNADRFCFQHILDPLRGREDLPLPLLGIAYPTEPFPKTP